MIHGLGRGTQKTDGLEIKEFEEQVQRKSLRVKELKVVVSEGLK